MPNNENQTLEPTPVVSQQDSIAAPSGQVSIATPTNEVPAAAPSEENSISRAGENSNSVAKLRQKDRTAAVDSNKPSSTTTPQGEASAPAAQDPAGADLRNTRLVKLFPPVEAALRILTRRLPIIAGQSAADYFELLDLVLGEWSPTTYQECSLVKQIADCDWQILTSQELTACLFNAEVAESLVTRIVDIGLEAGDARKGESQSGQPDAGSLAVTQNLRAIRRTVYAAVAGDKAAIDFLEKHLGPGAVGMNPHIANVLKDSLPAHAYVDSRVSAALAQRNAAIGQLLRLSDERRKRIQDRKMTVGDVRGSMSLSEYAKFLEEVGHGQRSSASEDKMSAASSPAKAKDKLSS
jgi:hypothetical protein